MGKPDNPRIVAAQNLVGVLRGMAFFEQRVAVVAHQLQPGLPSGVAAAGHIINLWLSQVPEADAARVGRLVAQRIVATCEHCPVWSVVRTKLAEAILEYYNLTFAKLADIGGRLLAFPPQTEGEAEQWSCKLAYTAILKLGREVFRVVEQQQWESAVVDVLFSNTPLLAVPLKHDTPALKTQRDFSSLLPRHDKTDS